MITVLAYPPDYDVSPQAIFWRPLAYFTARLRQGADDLDEYRGASFVIGNIMRFDLRRYHGHPPFTTTMYLPVTVTTMRDVVHTLRLVTSEMALPGRAVAWRRGQPFRYGTLERSAGDRLREAEARVLALKIAARAPRRRASTEYIKERVPELYPLSPQDRVQSTTRPREQRWQQIVGNVVSHRETPAGPFKMGYAERTVDGLSVTKAGLTYLNNMGFSA
jgi:hypothetical protein